MRKTSWHRGIFVVCAAVLLAGCAATEYSETLYEPATVEQMTFVPRRSGTGVGVGVSPSDGMPVTTVTSVEWPEQYVVVFACKHGKFALNPRGEDAKRLWGVLKQGQAVTIQYQEVYRVQGSNKVLIDLNFIDAKPTLVEQPPHTNTERSESR